MAQNITFGLKEISQILFKRIWYIILTTSIFICIAAIISYFVLPQTFEASTIVIIGNSPQNTEGYDYNDVLMYQQLAKTYQVIATSKTVSEKAAKKLGKGITPEVVMEKISVYAMTDTQAMEITARSISGQDAAYTANALAEAFIDEAMRIFPSGNIQILDRATIPEFPVSPRPIFNMVIAALLGFILSTGIIILRVCLDTKVRNEKEISNELGIPVVGIIPRYEEK